MLVAAVAFAVVGCRKPVEVSFEADTQEVNAQGDVLEIALKSNGEWTVATTAEWITVSPTSGNGDATLTLTASANTSNDARTAEIVATTKDNSATLTLTQQAPHYYLIVTPNVFNCGSDGGEFTVEVSSNIDWKVSVPNWITSSVAEGSNNATVTLTVAPLEGDIDIRETDVIFGNPFGMVGEGTASDMVHVVQTMEPVLSIELTPNRLSFACGGETKTVTVNTEDGWTASVEEDWVVLSQNEGQGETEVSVTLGENPVYTERQTSVLFTTNGGITAMLMIQQEASPDPHFLEVSPLSFQYGKEGGEQSITIGCDTDWEVVVEQEWLSVTPQTGTGNATLLMTATPNTLLEPRESQVFVKSGNLYAEITVTQEAGDEPLIAVFDPDTISVSYTGSIAHANLTSNTSWILETVDWITLLNTSGEGDATIDLIVDYNQNPEDRIGYVNAKHNGQVIGRVVVVQEGRPNLLETDYTELEVRPEGGEYTIHVTSNQSWTVNTDAAWIGFTPDSGFGNGEFVVTVEPLPGVSPRMGHIKVRGSTGIEVVITVTQHQ